MIEKHTAQALCGPSGYLAPEVGVAEIAVEKGFGQSSEAERYSDEEWEN